MKKQMNLGQKRLKNNFGLKQVFVSMFCFVLSLFALTTYAAEGDEAEKCGVLCSMTPSLSYTKYQFSREIPLNDIYSLKLKNLQKEELSAEWDKFGNMEKYVKFLGISLGKQGEDNSLNVLSQTRFLSGLFPNSTLAQWLGEQRVEISLLDVNTPMYLTKKNSKGDTISSQEIGGVTGAETRIALFSPSDGKNIDAVWGPEYIQSSVPTVFTIQTSGAMTTSKQVIFVRKPKMNSLGVFSRANFPAREALGFVGDMDFGFGVRSISGKGLDLESSKSDDVNETSAYLRLGLALGLGGTITKIGLWSITGFMAVDSFGLKQESNDSSSTSKSIKGETIDMGVKARVSFNF